MIPSIAVIISAYAGARLLLLALPNPSDMKESERTGMNVLRAVICIVALVLIAVNLNAVLQAADSISSLNF